MKNKRKTRCPAEIKYIGLEAIYQGMTMRSRNKK